MDELFWNIELTENNEKNNMRKVLRLLAAKWACKFGNGQCLYFTNQKLVHNLDNPEEYK